MNLGEVNGTNAIDLKGRKGKSDDKNEWNLTIKRGLTVDVEELFKAKTKNRALSNWTVKMIAKLTGNFFQSLLSIFSCVVYVVSTYVKDQSELMSTIEYVVAGLFSVDYLWGF